MSAGPPMFDNKTKKNLIIAGTIATAGGITALAIGGTVAAKKLKERLLANGGLLGAAGRLIGIPQAGGKQAVENQNLAVNRIELLTSTPPATKRPLTDALWEQFKTAYTQSGKRTELGWNQFTRDDTLNKWTAIENTFKNIDTKISQIIGEAKTLIYWPIMTLPPIAEVVDRHTRFKASMESLLDYIFEQYDMTGRLRPTMAVN